MDVLYTVDTTPASADDLVFGIGMYLGGVTTSGPILGWYSGHRQRSHVAKTLLNINKMNALSKPSSMAASALFFPATTCGVQRNEEQPSLCTSLLLLLLPK